MRRKFFLVCTAIVALGVMSEAQSPSDSVRPYWINVQSYYYFDQQNNQFLSYDEYYHRGGARSNEFNLAVLVKAIVVGEKGAFAPNRLLHVVVRKDGRLELDKRFRIGILSSQTGSYTIPILVYGEFCEELFVYAELEGQATVRADSLRLDWRCGE